MAHLGRVGGHVHVFVGDVLEQRRQVDFLLVVAAEGRAALLADDGDHRLMVELGVIQAVEQMDGARAGSGQADADFTGELGMAGGHEGRHFLVPRLDEGYLVLAAKGADNAVDAIAGVAEDAFHAPFVQALQEKVGDGSGHGISSNEIMVKKAIIVFSQVAWRTPDTVQSCGAGAFPAAHKLT